MTAVSMGPTENSMKFGFVFYGICERTDKKTGRHTDRQTCRRKDKLSPYTMIKLDLSA